MVDDAPDWASGAPAPAAPPAPDWASEPAPDWAKPAAAPELTPHQAYRAATKSLAAGPPEQPAGEAAPQPTDYTTERIPPEELAKQWGNVAYGVPKGAAAFPAGGFLGDIESLGRHVVGAKPDTYFPTTTEGGYLGPKGVGVINPAATPEEAIGMGVGAMLVPGPKMLKTIRGESAPAELVPPAALAPERSPFGVTLSEGEFLKDPVKQAAEQRLIRQQDPHALAFAEQRRAQAAQAPLEAAPQLDPMGQVPSGSSIQAADYVSNALDQHQELINQQLQANSNLLSAARADMHSKLSPTGTVLANDPMEAANIIQGSVANEAERAQQAKSAAYAALDDSGTKFHPAAFNGAADKMRAMVEKAEKVDINPDSTPIANRALSKLDSIVQDVTQQRDPDTGRIMTSDPITPSALEEVRKRLNVFMGEAAASARMGKPSDAIAMRGIIDAWDGLIEDRIVKGTVTEGNPLDALSQMRYARGLNAAYRKTFMPRGAGDDVGQAIQKILGRYEGSAATPEQVQGMLYSPTNPLAVRIAGRLKNMFGETSPEFGAAKQGYNSFLTERPPGGEAWGPEKVADRIDQYTKGPGRSLTQAYLSPQEIDRLQTYGKAARQHAGDLKAGENPFEGVDWQTTFRQAVNGSQKAVGQINEALTRLGPTAPAGSTIRQGLFFNALQPVQGVEKWGFKQKADNLASLLQSTRNSTVYGPEHRQVIQSYIDMLRKLETPKGIYEPSGPAVDRLKMGLERAVGQMIGYTVARHIPGAGLAMDLLGMRLGGEGASFLARRNANKIRIQLPIIADEVQKWEKAQARFAKNSNWATQQGASTATEMLQKSLAPLGINLNKLRQLPAGGGFDLRQLQGPGAAAAEPQQPQNRAEGGATDADIPDTTTPEILTKRTAPFPEKPEGYEYLEAAHPSATETLPPRPSITVAPAGPAAAVEASSGPSPTPIAPTPAETPSEAPTGERRGVVDKLLGLTGPRYQLWPEKMIRSGATLAGDVASGAEPVTTLRREDFTDIPAPDANAPREGGFWPFNKLAPVAAEPQDPLIERTQDMAALAGGASIPNAETGAVGVFAGKLAKTADLDALAQAQALARQGASRQKIWDTTGWFQGDDKKWRFEIPDTGLKITPPRGNQYGAATGLSGKLSDVVTPEDNMRVRHPDVAEAYPELDKNLRTSLARPSAIAEAYGPTAAKEMVGASYNPKTGHIDLTTEGSKNLNSYFAHELQHAIQTQEGFSPGKPFNEDFSKYNRAPGEVEARNVEKRLNWSDTKRQATPPWVSAKLVSDTSKPGAPLAALEHNSQPFYSAVEQAVTNAPQQKMHGSQWLGWLKNQSGVKADELNELGLNDPKNLPETWKGPVTKAQVLQHVQDQGVGLKEVEKGGGNIDDEAIGAEADRILKQWEAKEPGIDHVGSYGENGLFAAIDDFGNVIGIGNSEAQARAVAKNTLKEIREQNPDALYELSMEAADNNLRLLSSNTKYSDYQLPGGENYRELLLTKPTAAQPLKVDVKPGSNGSWITYVNGKPTGLIGRPLNSENALTEQQALAIARQSAEQSYVGRAATPEGTFRSSHWDEPNVLAHMRMNDRDIPDVGKSLHLEELQSDAHQMGRKQGYKNPDEEQRLKEKVSYARDNLRAALNAKGLEPRKVENIVGQFESAANGAHDLDFLREQASRLYGPDIGQLGDTFAGSVYNHQHSMDSHAVPNFPFKQTWPDLLLKRAITKAAREGKDAISWTPGEQQAARYDLSKHVDSLEYNPTTGHLLGRKGNTVPIDKMDVPKEKLADYVGKDAAEKLLNQNVAVSKKQPKYKVTGSAAEGYIIEGLPDSVPISHPANGIFETRQQAEAEAGKLNTNAELKGYAKISGLDLKVGGTGMRSFYDKMLVDKANAIGKKYGAKVEWEELPNAGSKKFGPDVEYPEEERNGPQLPRESIKVPVLRLTPQLKEQAINRGMPLFSDTGKAGALASSQTQPNQQKVPRPVAQKPDTSQPEQQNRAHGGRVNPANINHNPTEGQKSAEYHKLNSGEKRFHGRRPITARNIGVNKPFVNSPITDVELFGNPLHAEALRVKGFNGFDRKIQHMVLTHVIAAINNPKILNRIIKAVPINMMNVLAGKKFSSQELLHNPAMLTHPLSVSGNPSVFTVRFINTLASVFKPTLTDGSAKEASLSFTKGTGLPANNRVTVSTVHNNAFKPAYHGANINGKYVESHVNPSEAQKQAGNYSKGSVSIHGLEIAIENPKGSWRHGKDKNNPWSVKMPAHYGYFKKTEAADSDHVDVYLGPHLKSPHVYVIDQVDHLTKHYDEAKVGIGFSSKEQFLNTYKRAFSDGKGHARIGDVHSMTFAQLKLWLKHGDTKAPFAYFTPRKVSHATVDYEPKAKNMAHRCAVCTHFIPARHNGPECTLVVSPINPQGWCNRFRGHN